MSMQRVTIKSASSLTGDSNQAMRDGTVVKTSIDSVMQIMEKRESVSELTSAKPLPISETLLVLGVPPLPTGVRRSTGVSGLVHRHLL